MSLRERLKAGTAPLHEETERASPLSRVDLTRDGYANALRSLYGFYVVLEPRVLGHPQLQTLLGNALPHAKTPWLEHDLRALGIEASTLPRCDDAPNPQGLAHAIGCAYVLEGATLGGRVLYKRLARRWGLSPDGGGRFLLGHGEATGRMWNAFVAAIDAAGLDERDRDAALVAACATFIALGRWFRQNDGP